MNKLYVAVGSLVITTIVMSHNSYDSLTAALLGAGTTINPYRIENCMDLQSMRQDPKAHYLLTKDIECNESVRWNTSSCLDNKTAETCSMQKDKCFWNKKYTCKGEMYDGCAYGKFDCLEWCDGSDWIGEDTCEDMYGFVPIGTKDNPFSGSLDGSGYTISNLDSYWPDTNNVGLFGVVNGGTIKNLRYIRSKISGQSYVGGMVGLFKGGIIENVISEFGVIEGDNRVGGLIGGVVLEGISADVSKIASYNCTVDGRTFVGGLVGENRDGIISESATSECNVSGSYDVGGLIGVNVGGEINNTYSNAKIGTGTRVGGSLGVNAGNGEVINAVSFGPVNCEFCDFNKTGGLIAYNESGSIVKSSYYNGDDNNKNDSGYGEAKTLNELSESGTYVAWDWDSVWGKDEGGNPFLVGLSRSSTALSDIDSEHASAESEENINIGETIIGMVYKIVNNKSEPVKDVTIAISVNGEPIKVRGESDEEGKFSIEGVNSSSGDLVTVFIERDNNQAATIAKKTDENLPSIDLYYNQLRINGSQPQMIFSNEISRLEYTGEYVHPDLESLFISKDKEILVREGKTLYVESGATFRLTNNLEVGNLELEGMILQKGYDLTVIDKFIQKGGIYDAGAGITLVKGDFVMDGGDFNGDKGLVEFAGDLVGMFRLNGGKFVSPSMLIVSTDWIQNGGEFIHNESTVVFAGTSHNIDVNESETFFNVVIDKKDNSGLRIIKDDKIKVLNDLTLIDGILEGGKIEAEGAVVHKSFFDGGDTIMEIKGDRNRSVVFSVGGRLPQVIFNAKSATARVEVMHTDDDDNEEDDVLIFDKPFNLINGNININEGDVWFNSDVDMEGGYIKMQGGSIVSAAPFRFYDGKITANYGAITFNSPLLLSGGEILLLDAELSVNNDTLIKNGKFRGGNGNVAFNGNLIMTGGTLIAPSGLMTVRGNMSLLKDKASFDNNGGTVSFEGMTRTIDMDGAKFGNLIIRKNPDEYLLLESGTTIIAEGNVDIERGALRDESIDVYGNMNMGPAAGTGSTSFEFKGTRPQTISLEHPTRFRGNITVNKTGDKYLRLESDINMTRKTQSIKVKSGGLDLNMHDIEFVPKAGLIVYKNGILLFRGREKHPVPTLYKESTVHYILERGPEVLDDVNYYNLILDSTRPLTFKPSDKGLTVFRDLTLRGGTLE
ncbi:hypothetical protein KKG16_05710, partial [Patescibacteria group bacterium]|nr:hypothetical protein [Patescibacteria group bacterium]